jgi:hypothetical protein
LQLKFKSSGSLRRVDWHIDAIAFEELAATIFSVPNMQVPTYYSWTALTKEAERYQETLVLI